MPPRDEQDFEQRRQQIIDGALQVFARKGFEKATNKDIAEAAGIGSPGLIYHYFQDKADLFRRVLEQRMPVVQLIERPETVMDLPPRAALTIFAERFLGAFDDPRTAAAYKILLSEVIRRPAVADLVNQVGPGRAFGLLRRYLAYQMDLGTLCRTDPAVAARCFVGPLIAFLMTREVFPQPDSADLKPATMISQAVEIFLRGMEPTAAG